jgi:alkylhydroperoxidase family enzyme
MSNQSPLARVPLVEPGAEGPDIAPLYAEATRQWGRVPRFLQLLAHAPAALEAWLLLDRRLRLDHLAADPGYVALEELAIVKTSLANACDY